MRGFWLIEGACLGGIGGLYAGAYLWSADAFKAMTELFTLLAIAFPVCAIAVFGMFGALWAVCRWLGKPFP